MKLRSIANIAPGMLVIENGMQKGFIFLYDCVTSPSTALLKACSEIEKMHGARQSFAGTARQCHQRQYAHLIASQC